MDFMEKRYDILVSTVVIEVGIDVPNATVMVVEHAERFGLSQLHQLRGRIGRGSEQSYCLLFGNPKTQESQERLKIMTKTCDGFQIAETDFRLRGQANSLAPVSMGCRNSGSATLSGTSPY